jgi:hypothetical protein
MSLAALRAGGMPFRALAFLVLCWLMALPARAVPSFARQTGQACAMCHVGGFGPQLTEFGIQFKLDGYMLRAADPPALPLAGMVMTGFTHTKKTQDAATLDGHQLTGDPLRGNDNLTLDQASLFVAGRLTDHFGIFSQITYDGLARQTSIDNADLRFADRAEFSGHHLQYGVSLNNNPGLQDPFNTLPAWAYPWIASNVAPGPSASAILDEAFGQKVTGLVGYGMLDDTWYGELGTYRMQSVSTQKFFGIGIDDRDPGALRSPLYARMAAHVTSGPSVYTLGGVLFRTDYQPDRSLPDKQLFRDLGVDASWRWTAPSGDTATVLADVIHETQTGSSLTEYNVTGSWFWAKHWGATLERFGVNAPGLPSRGTRLQFDWTPTGQTPVDFPDFNVRVGLQLTAYDKLDGAGGSAASNANSAFLFAWFAF